jgi:hypothetical protein
MKRDEWIRERAYHLWQQQGCPDKRDLDFWLAAEREYTADHICIMSLGHCDHQISHPTVAGGHVAICDETTDCCNLARHYLPGVH